MNYAVTFITCANKTEAESIARALVKEKLAACVNIIENVESVFWWEGKIDSAREVLLIAKTKKPRIPQLIKTVKAMHSYQVPEIITLPISNGYKPYLAWLDGSCS